MDTKRNALSESEIIEQADVAHDATHLDLMSALESFYMSGFHDDQTGTAEAPDGHMYRVHRWIVRTDNYGFKEIETYDSEAEAVSAMMVYADDYCLWAGDDE